MSEFVYFTPQEKEAARNADIAEMLERQGERLKRSGSEYELGEGSERVTIRGNLWYHQYEQKGGDAIDFVRRFYNKDYAETVEMLLNGSGGQIITSPPIEIRYKNFELPQKNDRMSRLFSYLLLTRGIDKDVLYEFVRRKMIYESADYHSALFVGYDTNGKPRHAHKRGTVTSNPYKGNVAGSQPEFSFHWHGKSDRFYLFEAPIDMLSFISMHKENWKSHSYGASCSVSNIRVQALLRRKSVCSWRFFPQPICICGTASRQNAPARVPPIGQTEDPRDFYNPRRPRGCRWH